MVCKISLSDALSQGAEEIVQVTFQQESSCLLDLLKSIIIRQGFLTHL